MSFNNQIINRANIITLVGFWLTSHVIILRFYGRADAMTASLSFLAIATDFFDGYIARKYGCETELGAALDRARDKLFALFHFWFILISYRSNPIFPYIVSALFSLFMIELTLTMAGIWGIPKNKSVRSNKWGKRKMFFECAGIVAWIIFHDISPFDINYINFFPVFFILICFAASFFLAGKSLQGYWNRYFNSN